MTASNPRSKPIILPDFTFSDLDTESEYEAAESTPAPMSPASISPIYPFYDDTLSQTSCGECTSNWTQTSSKLHSPHASYSQHIADSQLSMASIEIIQAPKRKKKKRVVDPLEIIDLTNSMSDGCDADLEIDLAFISHETCDRRKVIDLSERMLSDHEHNEGQRSKSDHEESEVTLITIEDILQNTENLSFANIEFQERVEFLVDILKIIMQKEDNEQKEGRSETEPPSICIISPRRHSAQYICDVIKEFLCIPDVVQLITGGVRTKPCYPKIISATPGKLINLIKKEEISLQNISAFVIESKDIIRESYELTMQLVQISRHLPRDKKMQLLYFNSIQDNEEKEDMLYFGDFKQDMDKLRDLNHFTYVVHDRAASDLHRLLTCIRSKRSKQKIIVFFATKLALIHAYNQLVKEYDAHLYILYGSMDLQTRESILGRFSRGGILFSSDLIAGSVALKCEAIVNYSIFNFKAYIQRATLVEKYGNIYNLWHKTLSHLESRIMNECKKERIKMKDFHNMMRKERKPKHKHRERSRERDRERRKRRDQSMERYRVRSRGRRKSRYSDSEVHEGKHNKRQKHRYHNREYHTRY